MQQLISMNRAARRRMKRALKMPFTPSVDFYTKYLEKLEASGAVQRVQQEEPVKHRVTRRAFEDQLDASSD